MKKRNLVIARSGSKSLHLNWLKFEEPDFDLIVTFYGNEIPLSWSETDHYYEIIPIKGSKWKGLYKFLKEDNRWKEYDQILLPDDDLLFSAKDLNNLFRFANEMSLDLCQPALDEKSYFSHVITLIHESFDFRITNFVELMIPCMSRRMLESSLEIMNESESGWGMDEYWTDIINSKKFNPPIIFDSISITHTRPVGIANNGTSGEGKSPHNEMLEFRSNHGLKPRPYITLGGKLKGSDKVSIPQVNSKEFEYIFMNDLAKLGKQDNTEKLGMYIFNQHKYFANQMLSKINLNTPKKFTKEYKSSI